jgi:CHASE2 domain-containing sensor protein
VRLRSVIKLKHKYSRSALAALVVAGCGVLLSDHVTTRGEWLMRKSYDNLFRFDRAAKSNNLVLVLMDNAAYGDAELKQNRGGHWDRALHTKLLYKLADDGCAMVVMDTFFREARDERIDAELVTAMRRHGKLVLMAWQAGIAHPSAVTASPIYPAEPFRSVTTSIGVAWLDPDPDGVVRRHWPFLAPEPYLSLPRAAAQLGGAQVTDEDSRRWVRYYKAGSAWTALSYHLALNKGPGFFRDKVVFIGNSPATTTPQDSEDDEFQTPYTRLVGTERAGMTVGGVEILATEYLNLINRDWLRRLPDWVDIVLLVVVGGFLGIGCCGRKRWIVWSIAVGAAVLVTVAAASLTLLSNYWFPWLIIVAAQIPCAVLCAIFLPQAQTEPETKPVPRPATAAERPDTRDYEFVGPPFGEGAFGKVWLVRNAIGEWRALKAVYRAKFGEKTAPYDREFSGIEQYKPVSHEHPGLLRIEFISRKREEGHFYYVMELGDSSVRGWEENPALYKARDLSRERENREGHRLPAEECVSIGLELCEALGFLHGKGLAHRDIKPSNVIFVNGHPKLADIGLVTEIRLAQDVTSYYGTPGYLPPPPEPPGTVQADVYALGMLLYVISTGRDPSYFPVIATTLLATENQPGYMFLNPVVLKACDPTIGKRYQSVSALRDGLLTVQENLKKLSAVPVPQTSTVTDTAEGPTNCS